MSHEALRNLVAAGQISGTLAAQVTALADAGVPIVVTGSASADRRDALAAAIAAASPLPAGAESAEIKIAPEEAFVWLADPAGVGCLVAGAGGAPRSPRSTRLIAHGLIERLSAATTKTVVRSWFAASPSSQRHPATTSPSCLTCYAAQTCACQRMTCIDSDS